MLVPRIFPVGALGTEAQTPGAHGLRLLPGIYTFGLFATDIFVNAGQVVTGNLAPHFLALCRPNYTALGCQQLTQFISGEEACTGDPELVLRARKTFPSKEAALSVYAAVYLTVSVGLTAARPRSPRAGGAPPRPRGAPGAASVATSCVFTELPVPGVE